MRFQKSRSIDFKFSKCAHVLFADDVHSALRRDTSIFHYLPGTDCNMAPRKRKQTTKAEREQIICQKKIKALDKEESISNEDRFTVAEKRKLLEAYYANGFKVFQDVKLLQQYLPDRRENDLKGLLSRLCHGLQVSETSQFQAIDEWQRICQNLVGNFSRDKKVSLDDILVESLAQAAEELMTTSDVTGGEKPDYCKLLKDFSELLRGHFPENTTPTNAAVSTRLFEHIKAIVSSIDATTSLESIFDGSWLLEAAETRRQRHEMALKGMEDLRSMSKTSPTRRDLSQNPNVEALCLELPKIRRIIDVLNPLHLHESIGCDDIDTT